MKGLWRLAGGLCLVHVVLLLGGYAQQRTTNFGAAPADVVSTYRGVPATSMYTGGFMAAAAWLVLVAVLPLLARLLRGRTDTAGWLSGLIVTAGGVAAAITLGGAFAVTGGAYFAAAHGYDAEVVAGVQNVAKFADLLAMGAIGLCVVAVGGAVLASRALPVWLGWVSLPVGVLGIAGAANATVLDLANLVWLAWLIVLAVVLMRGPARSAQAAAENRVLAGVS